MKALLQRVTEAKVVIAGETVASIDQGLMVLVGIDKPDTHASADKLLQKLLQYRVFSDEQGKMNLSVSDINGGLLLVPQFTLAADTRKGLRPSFSSAKPPAEGAELFDYFVAQAKSNYANVATGVFGADMQVHLINDGPVTFLLEV